MFNDVYGLTAAVLNGTKTQTRRIVPDKIIEDFEDKCEFDELIPQGTRDKCFKAFALQYAPYKVREILAIAQRYSDNAVCDLLAPNVTEEDAYMIGLLMHSAGWENKMFVKSALMPNLIEIIKVRVERLQDISDSDCFAEGITSKIEGKFEVGNGYGWDTTIERLKRDTFLTPRAAYAALIDKISGKGTWERNPYVFAYEFKLVFKLTDAEKEEIRQYDGSYHNDDDFSYIESIAQKMDFYTENADFYKVNSKRITPLQAISLLGREEFWSGVLRAAYHGTAVRGNILIKNYN